MATVKLTHAAMTRRAVFPDEHPSWADLSHRVEAIFEIPAASVALSYVDPDGDTMYISSNDELFDFFHTEPSHPHNKPPLHRFTVHDMRQNRSPADDFEHVPGGAHPEDEGESSSASSASSSEMESNAMPDLGERRPSRSMGIGGMGIGFAPFEMMFGPAASAANAKSPSQGHISPVPTDLAAAAVEAGQTRSQFGRTVSSSSARSESTAGDRGEGPHIHIQQPSDASVAGMDPVTPAGTMHPMHATPALYYDVANFVSALSGAVDAHPEVSNTFQTLISNASSGTYWDSLPPSAQIHEASAHHLLGAVDSLLRTFFPPPPPQTPTQSAFAATPAYTAANFELPASVVADETPVPSRFQTPSHAPMPLVASPAMTASSIPTVHGHGPIRPVLDTARADRSSVRSDTDAGSIVSGGMGSPLRGTGPAWRFAGRSGGAAPSGNAMAGGVSGGAWKHYPPHPALNNQTGAVVPAPQPDHQMVPEAAKYVESRVRLEHMKEMYKQTKEEYRREREERKREREEKKRERLLGPPPPPEPVAPPAPQGDMFDRLNQALTQIPGRVGMHTEPGRSGIVPPAAPSVAGSTRTSDTAIRTRQQLNNWLIEQLEDMGFTVTTHPQVGRLVRDATRPYAANAEAANENTLLEGVLAQLVPTSSKI